MNPTGAFVGQSLASTRGSATDGAGTTGTDWFGATKLKAAVRSPTAERRHALRFGTSAPKRRAGKSRVEARSKTLEQTKAPRLKGETTRCVTRNPSPIGPRIPSATVGSAGT